MQKDNAIILRELGNVAIASKLTQLAHFPHCVLPADRIEPSRYASSLTFYFRFSR